MNKNIIKNKFGFTLIEMLVVIAIIAILASVFLVGLGGFRGSAYDSRRLSDLQRVQSYLELYYNINRSYPSASDWQSLENALINANVGVTKLPRDPQGFSYEYGYCNGSQGYILAAKLNPNSSAFSDNDQNVYSGGSAGSSWTCTGFQPTQCGTPSPDGKRYYCVGQK
jgi:prepilin-type N-terminal cleavage/methylation domain-containing protein